MILALIFTLMSQNANAQVYDGANATESSLQAIVDQVQPGSILVIGEMHGMPEIHAKQVELLAAIRTKGIPMSVGMEFLNFTDQALVDDYRAQKITEDEFKIAVNWGNGFDFKYYKDQILFPLTANNETTLGLNVPSTVTRQISKGGYASLTDDQKALLPSDFTIGNDLYKKRFEMAMGGHMPADKLDNYFAAQSAWDEAMANTAVNYVATHPDQIFVIVVGEFHVQYGGGLPDRLRARAALKGLNTNVVTVSQIPVNGLTADEISLELMPSLEFGKRSDFVWLIEPLLP